MQIEEGKSYLDASGVKWTNPRRDSGMTSLPWRLTNQYGHTALFSDDGESGHFLLVKEAPSDPAPTGPVVVETRKRIVSGTYRFLQVLKAVQKHHIGVHVHHCEMTAVEIRTLIAQLTEIADALEENGQ